MTGADRYDGTEPQDLAQPHEPVVVRDRRKIDPETGELRQPAEGEAPDAQQGAPEPLVNGIGAEDDAGADDGDAGVAAAAVADLEKQLEERTNDLQRVQAEFANYRRRVDKEREQMASSGKASVVGELLPLLDDLERAEQHGDLTGAFKSVADKLVSVLERAGLESFAIEGEPFDPSVHEAVQHSTSPEVDGPTVTMVMRRGYRFADRVLRAALVGVTDHEPEPVVEGEVLDQAVEPVERDQPVEPGEPVQPGGPVDPHQGNH